jgi:REP element-mobilizing transposase RayT
MVLAHHVIFTAYGFWLPNDPRGSWSDFVRSWELSLHGYAAKIDVRHSVAQQPHDRQIRIAAKSALKYPPIRFTGRQTLCLARGFDQAVTESDYVIWACSILPNHIHMAVSRHERKAEQIIGHLKARATQQLVEAGMHLFVENRGPDGQFPSVWTYRAWKVFLNSTEDIERAIQYVENNPINDGKKAQNWSFVTGYAPFGTV